VCRAPALAVGALTPSGTICLRLHTARAGLRVQAAHARLRPMQPASQRSRQACRGRGPEPSAGRDHGKFWGTSCRATSPTSRPKGSQRPRVSGVSGRPGRSLKGLCRTTEIRGGGAPTQSLRLIASFGLSTRTSPEEAVAKLVKLLDDVHPTWRSYVKAWDGVRGGVQHGFRS
jgi:hypothetical protein